MTALLQLDGVDADYGATAVLRGVSLEVPEGGMVALLGANGAGKTTTLRAICNMGVRTRGQIRFAGRRIDGVATEDIVRLGIGHAPEGRGTFLSLTVEENLRLGALMRRDGHIADDITRVRGYFPKLSDRMQQQAGTLSGGEQQMLAISRALMVVGIAEKARPRLLLLDEPSFGLAPLVVQDIFKILRVINREENMSMLLVEQNARLALELVGHVYLLETGRVVANGSPQQIAADETVRRAYLGQ
ncbi:MAG: ABC transporter ATP-binding protein [Deltaproteobacteria bacterium]|nr:MAG: ABC transporter ATP-binding protein [Deltaproteobacteria bacterium]TMQ20753.1 MAG: ABC transporter ATP-binding protein [Deltaproteobacteria bacterium]